MKKTTEFGQGLCYNLGLFMAHAEKIHQYRKAFGEGEKYENEAYELWFYGAGDHLFDFLPQYAPKHLRKRCEKFQKKVLQWRNSLSPYKQKITKKDFVWAIQEAKDLLRLIDRANGVPSVKGEYE